MPCLSMHLLGMHVYFLVPLCMWEFLNTVTIQISLSLLARPSVSCCTKCCFLAAEAAANTFAFRYCQQWCHSSGNTVSCLNKVNSCGLILRDLPSRLIPTILVLLNKVDIAPFGANNSCECRLPSLCLWPVQGTASCRFMI